MCDCVKIFNINCVCETKCVIQKIKKLNIKTQDSLKNTVVYNFLQDFTTEIHIKGEDLVKNVKEMEIGLG